MALQVTVVNITGQNGSDRIFDTALYTPQNGRGPWSCIECVADCVFTTLTDQTSRPDDLSAMTMKAGQVSFGQFTAIQLTSGKVRAYV